MRLRARAAQRLVLRNWADRIDVPWVGLFWVERARGRTGAPALARRGGSGAVWRPGVVPALGVRAPAQGRRWACGPGWLKISLYLSTQGAVPTGHRCCAQLASCPKRTESRKSRPGTEARPGARGREPGPVRDGAGSGLGLRRTWIRPVTDIKQRLARQRLLDCLLNSPVLVRGRLQR